MHLIWWFSYAGARLAACSRFDDLRLMYLTYACVMVFVMASSISRHGSVEFLSPRVACVIVHSWSVRFRRFGALGLPMAMNNWLSLRFCSLHHHIRLWVRFAPSFPVQPEVPPATWI
jgi:hypothetical protein